MTPNERLRELLDERGVEYEVGGNDRYPTVFWRVGDAEYTYVGDGRLSTLTVCDYATPEQAIEATLGRGECVPSGEWESISQTQEVRSRICACGEELGMDRRDSHPLVPDKMAELPNYCPNCGAKVVQE